MVHGGVEIGLRHGDKMGGRVGGRDWLIDMTLRDIRAVTHLPFASIASFLALVPPLHPSLSDLYIGIPCCSLFFTCSDPLDYVSTSVVSLCLGLEKPDSLQAPRRAIYIIDYPDSLQALNLCLLTAWPWNSHSDTSYYLIYSFSFLWKYGGWRRCCSLSCLVISSGLFCDVLEWARHWSRECVSDPLGEAVKRERSSWYDSCEVKQWHGEICYVLWLASTNAMRPVWLREILYLWLTLCQAWLEKQIYAIEMLEVEKRREATLYDRKWQSHLFYLYSASMTSYEEEKLWKTVISEKLSVTGLYIPSICDPVSL